MEADAELRAFLRRDEHLAPTGFVTRVISACRNNQELRNDGHCHPAPVTTIEQLKKQFLGYLAQRRQKVGRTSALPVRKKLGRFNISDGSRRDVQVVWRDTSRDVPARKDNRILRNWHGQARRIHNRVSVEAGGNPA
jgi:hypothetical protein